MALCIWKYRRQSTGFTVFVSIHEQEKVDTVYLKLFQMLIHFEDWNPSYDLTSCAESNMQ